MNCNLPKTIKVGEFNTGHVQGIAIDKERKYLYLSFTTCLVKAELSGRVVGVVSGLAGHLGCIAYNYEDGKVYGSLEYKHDQIGKGILSRTEHIEDVSDGFYIAVFDVEKIDRMDMDAEKDGVARLSTGDADPRITPIGHFIRKVRIDELPQLINILLGDMTIVGPRPERPEIAAQYEQELPEFRLRLQAKAGLTGYAQVYGKYNTTPYDKLQMDLMYIANPSFLEDLHIIFATIKILFLPESTEGVAEGQETAMK